jgi:hypothetical protein
MTHVIHQGREYDEKQKETIKAYFQPPGGAIHATRNTRCFSHANNFFNFKNNN